MSIFSKVFFISAILTVSGCFSATQLQAANDITTTADTADIYHAVYNDSDDLFEEHPADDIYDNMWTTVHINPYKVPMDSLPDTLRINCSHFHLPVPGIITSNFGPRRYEFHYGTDLRLRTGDSVHCAFKGVVRIIEYERHGYGHYIVVRHENGLETVYAHLSKVLVKVDERVKGGEVIGLGGSTGRSTGPHLHFEIRYLGYAINPQTVINFHTGHVRNVEFIKSRKKVFAYARAQYYRIRRGDNLGYIALRHRTTVRRLCRLNGIRPQKILRIGQRIRVR